MTFLLGKFKKQNNFDLVVTSAPIITAPIITSALISSIRISSLQVFLELPKF